MSFLRISLFVLVCVSVAWAQDDGYTFLEKFDVDLEPNECESIKFHAKKEFGYKIETTVVDGPRECLASKKLRLSEGVFFRGKGDIYREQDMCKKFDGNSLAFVSEITGAACTFHDDYFFAAKSTCNRAMKLNVKIFTRDLTSEEDKICDDAKALGAALLAIIVVVAVIVIILLVLCICCCCSACPLYKWRNKKKAPKKPDTITMQTQVAVPMPHYGKK